jgi:sporulation protein YlmC with PRC-barrel domain
MKHIFIYAGIFLFSFKLIAQDTRIATQDIGIVAPYEQDINNASISSFKVSLKDGYFGVVDSNKNVVIPYKYSYAVVIDSNLFAVKKANNDSLLFFLDNKGNNLFSINGSYIKKIGDDYISVSNKQTIFKGVINKQGKWIVQPGKYDYVGWIRNGFVFAYKNGKHGIIDLDGKRIIPFEYDNISITENNQFIVYKNGDEGALNLKNEFIIPLDNMLINDFGKLFYIRKYNSDISGLFNLKGENLIEGNYDIRIPIRSGSEEYRKTDLKSIVLVTNRETHLQGLYRADGLKILPIEYDNINTHIYSTISYEKDKSAIIIAKKNNSTGRLDYAAINNDGKVIVAFSENTLNFIDASPYLLLSTNREGKSAFVNGKTGEIFTGYEYKYVSYENQLSNGYIAARKKQGMVLISPDGKKLIDNEYNSFSAPTGKNRLLFDEEIICVEIRDNKFYGITKLGKEILAKGK